MKPKVLIIGGTGDIGSSLTATFSLDYEVFFTYNKDKDMASKLSRKFGATPIHANIKESSSLDEVASIAGAVDVLIYNTGVALTKLVCDVKESEWKEIIDINLSGAFYATQKFLPNMIQKKQGCIIYISSVWGVHGASCEVPYSASKAGMIGMAKALAKEVGPSNIRVNVIAPGVIEGKMNAHLSPEELNELAYSTPLMRLGTPQDVAQAAYFLTTASFITGQVLGVDGGFY